MRTGVGQMIHVPDSSVYCTNSNTNQLSACVLSWLELLDKSALQSYWSSIRREFWLCLPPIAIIESMGRVGKGGGKRHACTQRSWSRSCGRDGEEFAAKDESLNIPPISCDRCKPITSKLMFFEKVWSYFDKFVPQTCDASALPDGGYSARMMNLLENHEMMATSDMRVNCTQCAVKWQMTKWMLTKFFQPNFITNTII